MGRSAVPRREGRTAAPPPARLPCSPSLSLSLSLSGAFLAAAIAAARGSPAEVSRASGSGGGSCDAPNTTTDAGANGRAGGTAGGEDGAGGGSCRLYIAPSSIPGAGLGVFLGGTPLRLDEPLPRSAAGDVVLQATDVFHHWWLHERWCSSRLEEALEHARALGDDNDDEGAAVAGGDGPGPDLDPECQGFQSFEEDEEEFLPSHYYWASHVTGTYHHARHSMSFVPGVGALVNGHPGLINVGVLPPALPERDEDNKEGEGRRRRSFHPGSGSYTTFDSARFFASHPVPPFTELFADYGEKWFLERTAKVGHVPLYEDWDFAAFVARKLEAEERRWEGVHNLAKGHFDGELGAGLWKVVREGLAHSERWRNALPEHWEEAMAAVQARAEDSLGPEGPSSSIQESVSRRLALKALPGAVRSLTWLETNGRCMDNVEHRPSMIPHAGRGAFARRLFRKGEVVLTSPMVPVRKGRLRMYREIEDEDEDHKDIGGKVIESNKNDNITTGFERSQQSSGNVQPRGWQLYLNYCLGHPLSSLVLFPYAAGFNLVNHHPADSNAFLRWGTAPLSYAPGDNSTVESVLRGKSAGPIVAEMVAARDIAPGEEVLLHYGAEWEEAWRKHVRTWRAPPAEVAHATAADLNRDRVVRTVEEQRSDPYPRGVMTMCLVPPGALSEEGTENSTWVLEKETLEGRYDPRECDVLLRTAAPAGDGPDGVVVNQYTVRVHVHEEEEYKWVILAGLPREAVLFADRPYMDDQFLKGAFRHEVVVPEGMFPDQWLDLA